MNSKRGFSLLELLTSMAIFLFIIIPVMDLVLRYGDFNQMENARFRLQQESRYILTRMAKELKSAGSVLALSNTAAYLEANPVFNGIYPLNRNEGPDGLILAVGDPHTGTVLAQPFNTGGSVLFLDKFDVFDLDGDGDPAAWAADDIGILVSAQGYIVFKVTEVDEPNKSLTIRASRVYYSGLLNTGGGAYVDPEADGNAENYDLKSMVVRLTSFSIYLFDTIFDANQNRDVQQLIRVTDTNGNGGVLESLASVEAHVVSENVWDMQISYVAYPGYPADMATRNAYFAGGSSSTTLADLLTDIRTRVLKEVEVSFVVMSDEYRGTRGQRSLRVPAIGDRPAYTLPLGKYSYKIYNYWIKPRNFNLVLGV